MKIAILGWGSLLWDLRPEFAPFETQHEAWQYDGPSLRLEFARVSQSRKDALTLVIEDEPNGAPCVVAYAMSKRKTLADAICDLRCREGTILANIGVYTTDDSVKTRGRQSDAVSDIKKWAAKKKIEAVVWTDLASNFAEKSRTKKPFSVTGAIAHLQSLDPEGKSKAAEYIWCAPQFVVTPLRTALQADPWFTAETNRVAAGIASNKAMNSNDWKKQVPGCFGDKDGVFGSHAALDGQRVKAMFKAAIDAGATMSEIVNEAQKVLQGKGATPEHIKTETAKIRELTF